MGKLLLKKYGDGNLLIIIDVADTAGISKQIATMATVKEAGEEKINGVACREIIYTYKDKNFGTLTSWIAKDIKYQIKMESKNSYGNLKLEITNIKKTKLADDLFEVPKGFTKSMDM